ncbi:MAG TPA: HNH endonuclease family protein [Terriglobales bacterium]|nr:HNH endonuclease family protein [Terriglobales bacterium]
MGRMYELSTTSMAAEAEIHSLQGMWSEIYREIAKQDVAGEEILRITATLYYGPGHGKPRAAEESLELLRKECTTFETPRKISTRLLDVARKLVSLYASEQLEPVAGILHARLLAVAIMTAPGVSENERQKLLDQWERVTFRIFGLFGKDSRTKVGDYVRLAFQIVTEEIERRTYNQMMAGLRELGSEYPIDQALQEGVIGKDCYEQADVCRYLLWLYEEQLAKQLGTAATVDEKERIGIWKLQAAESIEHIFPRNPASQAAWQDKMRNADGMDQPLHPNVGRIGNLLLLALALNQQAQNLPFTKKKEIYAKHNLRMVREVSQQNDWTLSQIEQRELKISGWAKTRWSDI